MTSNNVYLGFADVLDESDLYTLNRQYLPLGKIGGGPAWLNPSTIPRVDELCCQSCSKQMAFLLQVYCTRPTDPPHAFHRTLFVFICREPNCSKANDASNLAIFRCQLPLNNPFYSDSQSPNPRQCNVNTPDPHFNANTYAKLCSLCGCRAEKWCASCGEQWYCCVEHQRLDWDFSHKRRCIKKGIEPMDTSEGVQLASSVNAAALGDHRPGNPFTFKEFGITMDEERINPFSYNAAENDSDSDSDDERVFNQQELLRQMTELKAYENANITTKDSEGIEETIKDGLFITFHKHLSRDPLQILRYQRDGEPLLPTDHSPKPDDIESVPNCELCGGERTFEFQLMPHLLSILDVDQPGQSIDYATILFYTCSCQIAGDGYAREFTFKMDFIEAKEKGESEAVVGGGGSGSVGGKRIHKKKLGNKKSKGKRK